MKNGGNVAIMTYKLCQKQYRKEKMVQLSTIMVLENQSEESTRDLQLWTIKLT